jgi:hypothetical protein
MLDDRTPGPQCGPGVLSSAQPMFVRLYSAWLALPAAEAALASDPTGTRTG